MTVTNHNENSRVPAYECDCETPKTLKAIHDKEKDTQNEHHHRNKQIENHCLVIIFY